MGMLENGAEVHLQRLKTYVSIEVEYVTDAGSVMLSATQGASYTKMIDLMGRLTEEITQDFLISVDDLIINEAVVIPTHGHKIKKTDGMTYEVLPQKVEPHFRKEGFYRFSDVNQKIYRLHTKAVEQ